MLLTTPAVEPDRTHKEHYETQLTALIADQFGIDETEAKTELSKVLKYKQSPILKAYVKDKNEDRSIREFTLESYMEFVKARNYVLTPSLTGYSRKLKSTDAKIMDVNKVRRNNHKKKAKQAKAAKDFAREKTEQAVQSTFKIGNNTYSGASSMIHLPLGSHTSHSTFTSVTQTTTATANALGERLYMGSRLYFTLNDVIDDIYIIKTSYDKLKWSRIIKRFKLKVPTLQQLADIVKRSTEPYFVPDPIIINRILSKLSDLDKMVYAYECDLYHLDKINPHIMKYFLREVTTKRPGTAEDFDIKQLEGHEMHVATHLHIVFYDELKGRKLGYQQYENTNFGGVLTNTMKHISATFKQFEALWECVLHPTHMMHNSNLVKYAYLRAVVASDTDASNPSAYHWTAKAIEEHYIKKNILGDIIPFRKEEALAPQYSWSYGSAVGVLFIEALIPLLMKMSANMNVEERLWRKMEMKSEITMAVYIPSHISKHYLELAAVNELVVMDDDTMEIGKHGVGLLSTTAAPPVQAYIDNLLNRMKRRILKDDSALRRDTIIYEVSSIEREVYELLLSGNASFFRRERINHKNQYSKPLISPYYFYEFYQHCLKDTYGDCGDLEWECYSLPMLLDSKAKLNVWIDNIEDKKLQERVRQFFVKFPKKDGIGRVVIPRHVIDGKGIPEIFHEVLDVRTSLLSFMKPIYNVLGVFGIQTNTEKELTLSETNGLDIFRDDFRTVVDARGVEVFRPTLEPILQKLKMKDK